MLFWAFWHNKTIVNLPAATTTRTMQHLAFPMGEKKKKISSFRAVQELPSLMKS